MFSQGPARDITPSDTVDSAFRQFLVTTTAGNVSIRRRNGETQTLSAVPVGVWIPAGDNAIGINATGTTAVGIFVS